MPQQNGRIERKRRHLLDTAQASRLHANSPMEFLSYCLLSATYSINLMPSSELNWQIPFKLLMNNEPVYDHLKIIGCLCFATVKHSVKLAAGARKCVLLGYPFALKGYKLLDLDTNKIVLRRDIIFEEKIFSPSKIYHLPHMI